MSLLTCILIFFFSLQRENDKSDLEIILVNRLFLFLIAVKICLQK